MKRLLLLLLLVSMAVSVAWADGQVTLSWTAPTLNCDDSPLNDLGGYIIKWWYADTPEVVVEQDVGNVLTATIDLIGNVEGKDVVFVAVSYDTSGNRSDDVGGCGASAEVIVPFEITYPRPPAGFNVSGQ